MKNKNRLEREWEALCSYQAEPSACSVGRGEPNAKKNRSDAVVVCESTQVYDETAGKLQKPAPFSYCSEPGCYRVGRNIC